MKRKELLWMMIPCLLLAMAAWYFTRRDSVPFGVVVEEARLIPVTALDRAQGYDTRCLVRVSVRGLPRSQMTSPYSRYFKGNSSVVSRQTGHEVRWPQGVDGTKGHVFSGNESQTTTYRFKLNKLPHSAGAVELHSSTSAILLKETSGHSNEVRRTAPVVIKVPLRTSGAPVPLPPLSRRRPFKLQGFKVLWSKVPTGQSPAIGIFAQRFEAPDTTEGRSAVSLFNTHLIADGTELGPCNSYGYDYDEKTGVTKIDLDTSSKTIPNRARNVVFKADLSLNECWPLPISVVLRKDGKNLSVPKAAPTP